MKKIVVLTLILASIFFGFSVTNSAAEIIFQDDFDSYSEGIFPYTGAWELIYSGDGSSYQYVDDTYSVSGSQSLHLVGGSPCYSATTYRPIDIPSQVTLEAKVFVDQIVSCGCSPNLGSVYLYNPDLGEWGRGFGRVVFACDGNIYATQEYRDYPSQILLMPYNAHTWYHVRSDIDLVARTYDVYIDGVLYGSDIQILDSGMPSGVGVDAGHGGNPTVWFDDVKVSSMPEKKFELYIKSNGSDGPLVLSQGDPVSVTIDLNSSEYAGLNADWWIAVRTPFDPPEDWFTYVYPSGWIPGVNLYAQTDLFDLASLEVLNLTLPLGTYTFYFALDDPDGMATGPWWGLDSVEVIVQPAPTTSIKSGPSGTITDNDVTFTYSGSDNETSTSDLVYSYYLDGLSSTWSSYSGSTFTRYPNLKNGSYTFKVRAKDEAGNVDASPATRSFSVNAFVGTWTGEDYRISSDYTSGGSIELSITFKSSGEYSAHENVEYNNNGYMCYSLNSYSGRYSIAEGNAIGDAPSFSFGINGNKIVGTWDPYCTGTWGLTLTKSAD